MKFRGDNPLDDVIEPEIGRKFCALIYEDDFSVAGTIPYSAPSVGGKETDIAEFEKTMQAGASLFADAATRRDAINEARKKEG